MSNEALVEAGKVAAALASLGGVFYSIWRWAMHPGYEWLRDQWKLVEKSFEDLQAVKEVVNRELTPNGGGSIKDAVARIDHRVASVEGKHRAMLIHSPMPMFEADEYGHCCMVNRAFVRLVGKDLSEVAGWGWMRLPG